MAKGGSPHHSSRPHAEPRPPILLCPLPARSDNMCGYVGDTVTYTTSCFLQLIHCYSGEKDVLHFCLKMNRNIDELIASSLMKANIQSIRPTQKEVIEGYLKGKDVLFCSPNGSGESLTFELSPHLYKAVESTSHATVIVVSPFVELRKEYVEKCSSLGLKAVCLNDVTEKGALANDGGLVSSIEKMTVADIRDGEADVIFTTPESILGRHRNLVTELDKQKHLKAVFIEEAQCISKFGVSSDKNGASFRPAYGQLGELRSLTAVPVIALTATACAKTRTLIKEKLCIQKCDEVIVSPNACNIKYWLCEAKRSIAEDFAWLADLLLEQGQNTPRVAIFFRKIRQMGDLYGYLVYSLRDKACVDFKPKGPNDDRNRLFDMLHSKTDDEVKESICSSFKDDQGFKRVVLVSSSFSTCLDVQGVGHVIHYGPAYDVEDYIQETGRAGRNQKTQVHAILMTYRKCLSQSNAVQSCMKQYCTGSSCRRVELLQHFESSPSKVSPPHDCCDVCALECKCQCHCEEICTCGQTCDQNSSLVMDKIRSSQYCPSDSPSDPSSDEDRSSDSEVDENTRRKPIVLMYSSESE
ncbi:ATP-dependent DNA helicase RecQ-like [Haliotis rufescens]|uniref:ATP-dependent DNA helicase RecQ-like n=1 Tax=Haliotis rufescens TaxID=6454 RepID=UPI00201F0D81|nr:ATP-dependent DNA helicase RecQ-like [Haliotis rufescens]